MILIDFSPRVVKGEKIKRTSGIHRIILLGCFVCLIGLSVAATYLAMQVKYRSQMAGKNQEIIAAQKNMRTLADESGELRNSLQKLEKKYNKLGLLYKDLVSRLDAVEQKNMQMASESAAISKDLETAKANILKLTGKLDAKLLKIEVLNADRQAWEEKYDDIKEILLPRLVLEPTWVSPGETTKAFGGDLLVILYEATEKDRCRKDTVAIGYLISGTVKRKLCLRPGKPARFSYQGKRYLFNLLDSKEGENAYRYCIYIMKGR